MSRFDLVYEQLCRALSEDVKYKSSVLIDYVSLLLSALKNQDFIDGDLDKLIKRTISQDNEVKIVSVAKEGLPPMKIEMSSPGPDKFVVTIINVLDEEDQKTFESSLSTNCIEDVIAYVRQKRISELAPENAVEPMAPSQGGEAQPGSQGSALPGIAAASPAAQQGPVV